MTRRSARATVESDLGGAENKDLNTILGALLSGGIVLAVGAGGPSCGWPLTVFLTSDQKPFFAGTYFPPKSPRVRALFTPVR